MLYSHLMDERILVCMRDVLLTRTALDHLPDDVWKRTSALNTWGTNAIEGNTLTWHDVERLLLEERSVGNRSVRDVMETLQHESTFRGLLLRKNQPITMQTVLELHESVFKGVMADAGRWRRVNVRIQGSKHTPSRMEKVVPAMENLLTEYESRDLRGEEIFHLGAWFHHGFESIHPFSDGNGRIGRLLLNLHFLKHNWPPVHILPPDRRSYLSEMERGHSDLSELVSLFKELMARSLLDMLDQVGTADDDLRALKSFESKGPYSAQYLRLRAGQGKIPAIKVAGDWHTSKRALQLYQEVTGRSHGT
jgi:Fic family protein